MSAFEERKSAQETKLAMDEKLDFKVEARCSKLYGLWAAKQLGIEGDEATVYAGEVVESNLEEPGFDDVLRKVRADFETKGLDISDEIMEAELEKALAEAKTQVAQESE